MPASFDSLSKMLFLLVISGFWLGALAALMRGRHNLNRVVIHLCVLLGLTLFFVDELLSLEDYRLIGSGLLLVGGACAFYAREAHREKRATDFGTASADAIG